MLCSLPLSIPLSIPVPVPRLHFHSIMIWTAWIAAMIMLMVVPIRQPMTRVTKNSQADNNAYDGQSWNNVRLGWRVFAGEPESYTHHGWAWWGGRVIEGNYMDFTNLDSFLVWLIKRLLGGCSFLVEITERDRVSRCILALINSCLRLRFWSLQCQVRNRSIFGQNFQHTV